MELTAVNSPRLYLKVAEQLAKPILAGELREGDALPSERELAARMQVSRPTIREAVTALEVMGLVQVRRGAGVFVTSNASPVVALDNAPGPFELLEARRTLEPEVAAFAAERIGEEQIDRLRQLLRRFSDESLDPEQIEAIDRDFHVLIAEATRNSALEGLVRWLWDMRQQHDVSRLFYQHVRERGLNPAVEEHRAILAALMARDGNAARELVRKHLRRASENLTELSLE